ncbi:MAG: 5-formyltetrahydrofolate cyclo-ligase [Erysipelotrichaceae bacterium]|nr:5-formyltetrahydrofolate cyclo-ligase [Erysipelotrichaceae bacterium]
MEEKKRLREEYKKRLLSLTEEEKAEDHKIIEQVLALPEYRQAKAVFSFVSRPEEIATRSFLQQVLDDGKTLAVPLCFPHGIMEARILKDLSELHPGFYGIEEPPHSAPLLAPEEISLALIPCLSADLSGNRLGFGGGYYDRYFAHLTVPSVLICREALLAEKIPAEEHDIRFPLLITEKRCIFFKK